MKVQVKNIGIYFLWILIVECQSYQLPKYQKSAQPIIVHPYVTNRQGKKLDLSIHHRYPRSVSSSEGDEQNPTELYIVIDGHSSDIFLELVPNRKLITAKTQIEWVDENGKSLIIKSDLDCFYLGKNLKSHTRRSAAISNCDGLSGYIEADDTTYMIEPLEPEIHSNQSNLSMPKMIPHMLFEIYDLRSNFYTNETFGLNSLNNDNEELISDIRYHFIQQNAKIETLVTKLGRARRSLTRRRGKTKRLTYEKKVSQPKRRSRSLNRKSKKDNKKKNRKKKSKNKRKRRKRKYSRDRKKNRKNRKTKTTTKEPLLSSQKVSRSNGFFSSSDWQGYSADTFEDIIIKPAYTQRNVNEPTDEKPMERWLETSIGVDHTVIDFHGELAVEKYIMTLFNIVSAIYEDPSLNAKLNIVILRLIFYKDKRQSQIKQGLAKKSLEAVNRWAERLHSVSPPSLQHDISVWLTKEELGGPSGYAPVGGVCQPHRSCTLNRDEGLTSAFIIAHEMAHVLGMSHDGDKFAGNSCKDEGFYGSVMAPLVSATFNRFHWSSCSKSEYHHLAPTWKCMEKPPDWGNSVSLSSDVTYHYSLDEQCRMEFGQSFQHCTRYSSSDPCTFLWCSNGTSHICKTKKGPPLEGTTCGDEMWCRYGFCEKKPEVVQTTKNNKTKSDSPLIRHNPQDGGWSSWSDWGFCSRTCGSGVTFKMRSCNNPEPKWGGKSCTGKTDKWKLCSTQPCPDFSDLRAQQCDLLPYLVKLGRRRSKLTWIPYEPRKASKKCRLSCWSRETNEIYMTKEFVLDGTKCSYDETDSICVQGSCHTVGCDGNITSSKKVDDCGVCGGDGSSCMHKEYIYEGRPVAEYQQILILPTTSRQISIRENFDSSNSLALMVNSEIVLGGHRKQEFFDTVIVNGARFHYDDKGGMESIVAVGPLLKPVSVMILSDVLNQSSSVSISFFIQERQTKFTWKTDSWEPCSSSCGGGIQAQRLVCVDEDTPVSVKKCEGTIPPQVKSKACNEFSCRPVWNVSPWEHCSRTCGNDGWKQRIVSCTISINSSGTQLFVHPKKCDKKQKPISRRECNRIACPGYWILNGWSQCSGECETGYQTENFICMGQVGSIPARCESNWTPQNRSCSVNKCREAACIDESPFCQIQDLTRYCIIPEYRERCCQSCRLQTRSQVNIPITFE